MAHEAGDSLPLWLAALSRIATCCTALQLQEHVFWTCTGASAIRRAIQHNLPVSVQLLPRHVWLLEQPCQTVRKEVWYVVCLAALIKS